MAEEKKVSPDIFKGAELVETTNKEDQDRGFKSFKINNDAFMQNMPEGITKSQYKAIKNYERDYANAAVTWAADTGLEFLKKEKDLRGVQYNIQFGDYSSGKLKIPVVRDRIYYKDGQECHASSIAVRCDDKLVSKSLIKSLKAKLTEELCK